ncbi:MAG: hypothetical protein DWQ05_05230 [Calditrichaeota bacterium]|nr:MAG: hypothetical protein DWQ05_05230 [Calditrichota bacterium]
MIQKDYFMRMIEQFAQALGLILSNKKKERWKEMDENIAATCEKLLGTNYQMFRHVETEDLVALLRNGEFVDSGKAYVLAVLFTEEAEGLDLQNNEKAATSLFLKSATLFIEVVKTGNPTLVPLARLKIPPILKRVEPVVWSVPFRLRLFQYYESVGQFANAENLLFDLAEENVPGMAESGVLFYGRLQKKLNSELENGNLNRQEVDEGKTDFVQKFVRK